MAHLAGFLAVTELVGVGTAAIVWHGGDRRRRARGVGCVAGVVFPVVRCAGFVAVARLAVLCALGGAARLCARSCGATVGAATRCRIVAGPAAGLVTRASPAAAATALASS
eukprot:4873703-Pleurochrysis_carterae.AAC.1